MLSTLRGSRGRVIEAQKDGKESCREMAVSELTENGWGLDIRDSREGHARREQSMSQGTEWGNQSVMTTWTGMRGLGNSNCTGPCSGAGS